MAWNPDPRQLKPPIALSLARSLADAIACRQIEPGDRIVTRRELAYRLGVSLRTVTKAFSIARDRGLIVSQIGRGTFAVRFPEEAMEAAGQSVEVIDLATNSSIIDPFNASLARLFGAMSRRKSLHALLEYQPSSDIQQHRVAAARWMALRGVILPPDGIQICHTLWEANITILSWIRSRNQFVVVDGLSTPGIRQVTDLYALKVLAARSDAEGMLPEDILRLGRRYPIGAIMCAATVHNPTTATMSLQRRKDIVSVAEKLGALIIDDDTSGHLSNSQLPTLTQLAPERSIYLCGVYTSIAPGLRVAFIGHHASLRAQLDPVIQELKWRSSTLMGEIASMLINGGLAEKLLDLHRRTAATRQRLAAKILGFPQSPELSAYFLWYPLPEPLRACAVVEELRTKGVAVRAAEDFAVDAGNAPNALRICLGAVRSEARLKDGLSTIASIVSERAKRRRT